jgi:hypothetical protein
MQPENKQSDTFTHSFSLRTHMRAAVIINVHGVLVLIALVVVVVVVVDRRKVTTEHLRFFPLFERAKLFKNPLDLCSVGGP